MPVCIAGMHRSGTSMVARLLHQCSLHFGPESEWLRPAADNQEGFWENVHFVNLNDDILAHLGGGWERPPQPPEGWEALPDVAPLEDKARDLAEPFAGREPWGWKDPRNSLTFPLWRRAVPDLKVVVCVRNPLEVAQSLRKRHPFAETDALRLWLAYNRSLLAGLSVADRIVTHYNSYFLDPGAELLRVVRLLNLPASRDTVHRVAALATQSLRHHQVTTQELLDAGVPRDVLKCYVDLCAEAGPVYRNVLQNEPGGIRPDAWSRILESSYYEAMHTARLEERIAGLTARDAAKDRLVEQLSSQLTQRDQAAQQVQAEVGRLSVEVAQRGQALQELTDRLAQAEEAVAGLTARLAQRDQALQHLEAEVAHKQESLQWLEAQAAQGEQALQALTAQVAEREATAEALAGRLLEAEGAAAQQEQAARALAAEKEQALQALAAERGQAAEREAMVRDLHARLLEREQTIQSLSVQGWTKEQTIQGLMLQVTEKDRGMQTLLAQLQDLSGSIAWRLAQLLHATRVVLAPTGSRRQRLLRAAARRTLRAGKGALRLALRPVRVLGRPPLRLARWIVRRGGAAHTPMSDRHAPGRRQGRADAA